ncbi:hypothetical protein [Paracoccus acridae]|nr:hypothetical protein [Paracoccus acridae]
MSCITKSVCYALSSISLLIEGAGSMHTQRGKAAIGDAIKKGKSPGQNATRMRLEEHRIRVSHEPIFQSSGPKHDNAF